MTAKEKNRLIRFAERLGRALDQLTTIVHLDTLRRWIRESKQSRRRKSGNDGRKRTAVDIRKLVLRLACENPGWGYTRILGELKKLGITPPSRGTIRNILREHGLDPAPLRGDRTWDEFLKLHATTLWQADFLSVRSLRTKGVRDLFLLVFLHVESRRVFITPSTTNPTESWVLDQAREFVAQLPEAQRAKFYVQHDRDTKFTAAFDASIKATGGKIVKTPFRSPNLQAFVERFHQTLRREVLDHFILFGQKHLDFLTKTFTAFYHIRRPHQSKDNEPLALQESTKKATRKSVTEPTTIALADVRCESQLGGMLKHYYRKAA